MHDVPFRTFTKKSKAPSVKNICDFGHIEQKNTDPKYLSFVMYILCILVVVYYYVFSGKQKWDGCCGALLTLL